MTFPAPKPAPALVIPEFRAFIARQPCLACRRSGETQGSPTRVCHYKTRRNAGDQANLWPGCDKHHSIQHNVGVFTFAFMYDFEWTDECHAYWQRFINETGRCDVCGGQNCGEGHALAF